MKGGRSRERIHTHTHTQTHTHTHTRTDAVPKIKREIGFLKIPEIQQKVRQVIFLLRAWKEERWKFERWYPSHDPSTCNTQWVHLFLF